MRTLQIGDQLSQERKVADLLAPGEVEPQRGKVSQGSKVADLVALEEVESLERNEPVQFWRKSSQF